MLIEWHEGNLGSRDTLDNQYLYPRDFAEQAKMAERLNLSYLKDVKIIDKNKEK